MGFPYAPERGHKDLTGKITRVFDGLSRRVAIDECCSGYFYFSYFSFILFPPEAIYQRLYSGSFEGINLQRDPILWKLIIIFLSYLTNLIKIAKRIFSLTFHKDRGWNWMSMSECLSTISQRRKG